METNFQSRSKFLRGVIPAAIGAGALLSASKPAEAASVANVLIDVKAAPYNATGNGTTNDAPAIQNAINAAAATGGTVWFPPGQYHLQTGLVVNRRVTLEGPGWHPNNPAVGAWFRISVAGTKALTIQGDAASGTVVRGLAFRFDQPAAVLNWSPVNYDFAITIDAGATPYGGAHISDVVIEDIHMLNPTRAIRVYSSAGLAVGRIHLNRISGEPLLTGIEIDNAMDICKVSNIHFWPYWSLQFQSTVVPLSATFIGAYKLNNANAFVSYRNDNPRYMAVFAYGYARGIYFRAGTLGITRRFRVSDSDFDYTGVGIDIDGFDPNLPNIEGINGMLSNVVMQGPDGSPCAIRGSVASRGIQLQISNMRVDRYGGNGIRIEGPGCLVTLDNTWIEIWNQTGLGFPAIEMSHATSKLVVGKTCHFSGGGANGAITGGAATIVLDS
jgi:hypothetical protein